MAVVFCLANTQDASQIQQILKQIPIVTQQMSYRIERQAELDAFGEIQGTGHEIWLAKEGPQILGFIMVVYDQVFLDGKIQDVAYTGELKLVAQARGKGLADRLMQIAIQAARQKLGPNALVFTTVSAQNPVGLKKNLKLGQAGIISMREILHYKTLFFPTLLPMKSSVQAPWSIECLDAFHEHNIQTFWEEWASEHQLARSYAKRNYLKAKGLSWLVLRRNQEIMGVMGVWDQRDLRQIRLEKPGFQERVLGIRAELPLPLCHLVHVMIRPEARRHLALMISRAKQIAKIRGAKLLGWALDPGDPLIGFLPPMHQSSEMILLSNWQPQRCLPFQMEIALG